MELLLIIVTDVCVGDVCVHVLRDYRMFGNIWPLYLVYFFFLSSLHSCCVIQYTELTTMRVGVDFTFTQVILFHILFNNHKFL